MIATSAILGLALVLAAWLVRAMTGPTLHDRALGAHAAVLTGALMAAALAALAQRAEWLDLSLTLVIADVLMVVSMLKVVRLRTLQSALARPEATPVAARER
jgi:multisubunit Na+/H+ antiporter MnhF subunit